MDLCGDMFSTSDHHIPQQINRRMNVIHILSATDRPDSNALKVSGYIEPFLSEKTETKLFSLKDFPLKDVHGGGWISLCHSGV
jgi:hypothetical protein